MLELRTTSFSTVTIRVVEVHGDKNLLDEDQFHVLKKCHGKFGCLVYQIQRTEA